MHTPQHDRKLVIQYLSYIDADPAFCTSKLMAFDMQIMDCFIGVDTKTVDDATGWKLDDFKHAYFRCFYIKLGTTVAALTQEGRVDRTVKKLEYAKFAKKASSAWSRSWDSSVEQLNYYSDAWWCDPQECGSYTYCEFPGFNYERTLKQCTDAELADIQPIIDHLRECLCGGIADIADQVEQILGFKLKHPFEVEKLGKALLFIGAAGIGKTMFFDNLFGLAFGKDFCVQGATNRDVTTGLFNDYLEGKFVVQLDDSAGNKSMVQTSRFKSLITEEDTVYRGRGHTVNRKHNMFFVMTMNPEDLARAPIPPGDRRFVICHSSAKYQDNAAYFNRLHNCLSEHWQLYVKYLLWKVHDVQRMSTERAIQTENSLSLIEMKMNPFPKWCLFMLREDISFFWVKGAESSPTFKMKKSGEGARHQMYTEFDQWYHSEFGTIPPKTCKQMDMKAFFAPYLKYDHSRAHSTFTSHESYINFIASNDFRKFFPELEYLFNHDEFDVVEPPAHVPVPAPRKPRQPPVPRPRVPKALPEPMPEPAPVHKIKVVATLKSKQKLTLSTKAEPGRPTKTLDLSEMLTLSKRMAERRRAIAPGN
jgi:hypothetical protein